MKETLADKVAAMPPADREAMGVAFGRLMSPPDASPTQSLAEQVALLPDAERDATLAGLDMDILHWDWTFWGRPAQHEPTGDWNTWLILAGRGFGKTRAGAEWVRSVMTGGTPQAEGRYKRLAIVAETAADARDVLVEGESGIMSVHPPAFRPVYEPSKRRLSWPNGAVAHLYNATEPDQLRGPQHDAAWCLTGDTSIIMGDGSEKPLCQIRMGEMVMTRSGPRKVLAAALTRRATPVLHLITRCGRVITGTSDHPVWSAGRFVPLARLKRGDQLWCKVRWNTTASSFTSISEADIMRPALGFTAINSSARLGLSRRGIIFTISTVIRLITRSKIFNFCRTGNIAPRTWKKRSGRTARALTQTLLLLGGKTVRGGLPSVRHSARCAMAYSAAAQSSRANSVPNAAATFAEQTHSAASARGANASNATGNIRRSKVFKSIAARHAGLERFTSVAEIIPAGKADVYDIAVEGEREFFANGILVHNCDELAKWRYASETWDQLQFGLRLGDDPRQIVTTTPRPIPIVRQLIKDKRTVITRGSTYENKSNLAAAFLATVITRYEGTRLGRQELLAEVLDDVPGALWTRAMIDDTRLAADAQLPPMARVVVGVDPSGTSGDGEGANEVGIVVAGRGIDGHAYVQADYTCDLSPEGWGRRVIDAYKRFEADRVVAEVNYGGAMVGAVIKSIDRKVSYKDVRAARGKVVRAEPIAALYEQGKVHHVGALPLLEDQLVAFTSTGYLGDASPDRADAMVWALTELMLGGPGYRITL